MVATTDFSVLKKATTTLSNRAYVVLDQLDLERTKAFKMITDSTFILVTAFKLRQQMVDFNKKIGQFVVQTDEDRSLCNDASREMLDLLEKINKTREKSADTIFLSVVRWFLDDMVRLTEDASETFSLASSLEFKELLDKTLVVNENP